MEKCALSLHLPGYLATLKRLNRAPSTIRGQKEALGLFVSFCVERGITDPASLTVGVVERYRKFLSERRARRSGAVLSASSRINLLCAVREYCRYLTKQGHMLFNPALAVELPKMGRHLPRVLSAAEAERIVRVQNRVPAIELRNRALLEVLYATGMRRSEISGLDLADVNFESGTILIREGKGGHDRVVPAGRNALVWIQKYLKESRPLILSTFTDCGALFLSTQGERGRMSTDTISHTVTSSRKRAGVEKEGSTHMFRHTAATLMLENGADVRFVQQLLGHRELGSTQRYTHVSIRKLKEVHEKTHPARFRREP
ncbi:MAG: tyrosine-type recombinase/integrase [Spirochaetales bacterium]|nr:tyrosine-type recombinase/integrase [Spirochaetales bacterium]